MRAETNSETFLQVPSNNTDRPLIGILSQVDLSERGCLLMVYPPFQNDLLSFVKTQKAC